MGRIEINRLETHVLISVCEYFLKKQICHQNAANIGMVVQDLVKKLEEHERSMK